MDRTNRSTITLHVVASMDGYIARNDNDVSWLNAPAEVYQAGIDDEVAQAEAERVLRSIDCYLMGSRTYEHALQLGWPYGDTPAVVVTGRTLPANRDSVQFYAGELSRLVDEVLAPQYRSVWLVGGARLCQSFVSLGLVDRIVLTIAPITLGDGLRLFGESELQQRWRLTDVVAFKTGFVELSYEASEEL